MPPIIRTTVPKPRKLGLPPSPIPGGSLSNLVNNQSSVGRVDDSGFDPISDLQNRIASEISAARKNAEVDVSGLLKSIKSSQSNWKPNVAGMIGPLGVSIRGGGGSVSRLPTGNVKLTGNVDSWIAAAYKALGIRLTPQALANERYLIQHESSGNPRAVNNWDINAKRGTPSMGIEQTIRPTFDRWKLPGLIGAIAGSGDIFDPIENIVASLRYRKSRYGKYDIGRYAGGY